MSFIKDMCIYCVYFFKLSLLYYSQLSTFPTYLYTFEIHTVENSVGKVDKRHIVFIK